MSSERIHLVLTALGSDRPGIVDGVSQCILGRGGNIESSRMAVLGGEFTLMVLVSGDEAAIAKIEADCSSLSDLQVIAKRTRSPEERRVSGGLAYRLSATSLDHPGIVQRVSHLLADKGVNIESAECGAQPGPWSGAPVFHLEMILAIPSQSGAKSVRQALETLSDEEGIDFELRAINA